MRRLGHQDRTDPPHADSAEGFAHLFSALCELSVAALARIASAARSGLGGSPRPCSDRIVLREDVACNQRRGLPDPSSRAQSRGGTWSGSPSSQSRGALPTRVKWPARSSCLGAPVGASGGQMIQLSDLPIERPGGRYRLNVRSQRRSASLHHSPPPFERCSTRPASAWRSRGSWCHEPDC